MNRIGKLLCLPALLTVALATSSARAEDPELKKTDNEKILEMLKQIQDDNAHLRQDLAKQQNLNDKQQRLNDKRDEILELRLKVLEDRFAELERAAKARVSNYPPEQPGPSPDQLRDLDARLKRLEQRQSSYFTPSEPVPSTVGPTTGIVRIVNPSLNTSQIRVNGVTFTVRPGETVSTTVPAGTFSFEVLADGRGFRWAPQQRVVNGNEMFTITVVP
jgi:hypothetical protein